MRTILVLLGLLMLPLTALAQLDPRFRAPIPPPRPMPPRAFIMRELAFDATIKGQVADVLMTQVFLNRSNVQAEAEILVPIAPEAVIQQFTLMVDGREIPAKMYPKEEAIRIYESIVRQRQDPALLQYMGFGLLKTQVFPVPAGAERKVTLRYGQLCRRSEDLTEITFPLAAARIMSGTEAVGRVDVTVRIEGDGRIKSVYSPTHPADVQRPSDTSAVVRYRTQQTFVGDDFRLFWNLSDKPVAATLITYRPDRNEDGYFLLLASPEVKADAAVVPKTVIFVLDRSGSMAGAKIEQARNALKFVLNNLRDGDLFNIVVYDQRVETFKPELQRFDNEARAEALRFVEGIRDGGSTNIDGALQRAFQLVGDTRRPSYVIFLTDGLPTAGEQNESRIAENAKRGNSGKARLFAFGVGFDVNSRLLDRLVTDNSGVSEYVRPNENIESAVAKLYSKIAAPVATKVRLELANADINRLYPRELPDLFAGSQVVAVGRYRGNGPTTIKLHAVVNDRPTTYEFPARLADANWDETNGFVEKLWAARRIGDIINELDLHGRNNELMEELVRLSTKHGILTPYTAFLADERTQLHAWRDNARTAAENTFEKDYSLAKNSSGAAGVNLRAAKGQMQGQMQAPQQGAAEYADADGSRKRIEQLQVVGNKALYKRQDRWVDPAVTDEELKGAEVIEQFSDRYFELARGNRNLRQYLAMPEGGVIKVDGKVYQINAQQNKGG